MRQSRASAQQSGSGLLLWSRELHSYSKRAAEKLAFCLKSLAGILPGPIAFLLLRFRIARSISASFMSSDNLFFNEITFGALLKKGGKFGVRSFGG